MVVCEENTTVYVPKGSTGGQARSNTRPFTEENSRGGVEVTSVDKFFRASALLLVILTFGCSTPPFSTTVYVPSGTPVRLREDICAAKIWVMVNGKAEPTTLTLKNGWYVVPDGE